MPVIKAAKDIINGAALTIYAPFWLAGTCLSTAMLPVNLALRLMRGRKEAPSSHGQAKLSELSDLKALGRLKHTGGFYVGRMWKQEWPWRSGLRRIYTGPEDSVLMVGRKGAGKSLSIIADIRAHALLDEGLHPDMLVYDPVGEIQQETEHHLRAMGWDVRTIDIDRPERGEQCDPLQGLRPGMQGYDFMLALLGQAIIPKPVKNPENEAHFPRGARAALIGMIAWEQVSNPHGCTLQGCMEKLVQKQTQISDIIDLMQQSPSALVRNNVRFLTIISPKEYGSFASTMATYFGSFTFEGVMALNQTRADADGVVREPIDFRTIFTGDRKTAIFIRTGLYGDEPGPALRLMLSNAINTKRWLLNGREDGKPYSQVVGLQRPFKIYTDETKTLGNCTALVEANDELRKARTVTWTGWLTRADIYNSMSGAKNLIGNSVLVLAGGNNDYETNMDMSRLIGDKTIYNMGTSYGRGGKSESYNEQGVPLMKPEAIRQIPRSKRLIVMDQIQFIPFNSWEIRKGSPLY